MLELRKLYFHIPEYIPLRGVTAALLAADREPLSSQEDGPIVRLRSSFGEDFRCIRSFGRGIGETASSMESSSDNRRVSGVP